MNDINKDANIEKIKTFWDNFKKLFRSALKKLKEIAIKVYEYMNSKELRRLVHMKQKVKTKRLKKKYDDKIKRFILKRKAKISFNN